MMMLVLSISMKLAISGILCYDYIVKKFVRMLRNRRKVASFLLWFSIAFLVVIIVLTSLIPKMANILSVLPYVCLLYQVINSVLFSHYYYFWDQHIFFSLPMLWVSFYIFNFPNSIFLKPREPDWLTLAKLIFMGAMHLVLAVVVIINRLRFRRNRF